MPKKLTLDDLDKLDAAAHDTDDPLEVAAELVAAVDDDHLADAVDAPYAFYLAAEILAQQGDDAGCLALLSRAADLAAPGLPRWSLAPGAYGRKLLAQGRHEEGVAQLAKLRPLLLTDPMMAEYLTEALLEADEAEVAHEWLTEALVVMDEPSTDPDADLLQDVRVFGALLGARYRVRLKLRLPPDEYDEIEEFDELDEFDEDDEDFDDDDAVEVHHHHHTSGPATIVFWPRDEHGRVLMRWPDRAKDIGGDWDRHRSLIEGLLLVASRESSLAPRLLAASMDGYLSFVSRTGADADDVDTMDDYVQNIAGPGVPWPPQRNEACWCGSGVKYKKCCLPRSRDPR